MSDLVERWPGYNEQSWAQRFAELDRRFSKERDTAVKAICQLSEQQSARIQALETSLAEAGKQLRTNAETLAQVPAAIAEARRQALEEAAKVAEERANACRLAGVQEAIDPIEATILDEHLSETAQAIRALAEPLLDRDSSSPPPVV